MWVSCTTPGFKGWYNITFQVFAFPGRCIVRFGVCAIVCYRGFRYWIAFCGLFWFGFPGDLVVALMWCVFWVWSVCGV